MRLYDFAGLAGGLGGAGLFLGGALVAILAGLRLALVARRPGKGRVARGLVAAGAVLAAAGAALFWVAELAPFRRAVDHATAPLTGAAILLGVLAGWRVARRRSAPGGEDGPVLAPASDGTPGRPEGETAP